MIEYKKGDLTEAPDDFIIHGCNAQGVMGSGVALAIRRKFPEAFKAYYDEYKSYGLQLGTYTMAIVHNPNNRKGFSSYIFNAITQQYYGKDGKQYVSYDACRSIFKQIATRYNPECTIAMPKIGCGLGGGNWEIMEKIIDEEFINFFVTIYEV